MLITGDCVSLSSLHTLFSVYIAIGSEIQWRIETNKLSESSLGSLSRRGGRTRSGTREKAECQNVIINSVPGFIRLDF